MFNLSRNQWEKNFRHIASPLSPYLTSIQIDIQWISMISMKTTENDGDRGRQYQSVMCFRDRVHSYVSYFQTLE